MSTISSVIKSLGGWTCRSTFIRVLGDYICSSTLSLTLLSVEFTAFPELHIDRDPGSSHLFRNHFSTESLHRFPIDGHQLGSLGDVGSGSCRMGSYAPDIEIPFIVFQRGKRHSKWLRGELNDEFTATRYHDMRVCARFIFAGSHCQLDRRHRLHDAH